MFKIARTSRVLSVKGDFYCFDWKLAANGEITGLQLNDNDADFNLVGARTGPIPNLLLEGRDWQLGLRHARRSVFKLKRATRDRVEFSFKNTLMLPGGGPLMVELNYTVYATGIIFCELCLDYDRAARPIFIKRLRVGMNLPHALFKYFRWWCFKRPDMGRIMHDEAGTIMTVSVGETGLDRNKSVNDPREVKGCLDPYLGIDFGREQRFSNHIEFFLERWKAFGTLDRSRVGNHFHRKGDLMHCDWDLLNTESRLDPGTSYRNTWGISVTRARQTGLTLGQRVYHWFEKNQQPTDELIDKMAKYGGSILCLHESSWPSDPVRCDDVLDKQRTKALVARCHQHGIKVMFYSRLYEDGLKKGWFQKTLKKNYDGIYVDGGTPWCIVDEDYSVPFRKYYRVMQLVRKIVGPQGLFISHTGPWITSLGTDLVDGYLSGEQERGHLMDDLQSNLFYTSQAIGVPMIWTGAFAQYRSPRAVAYYAGVGEFPHVNLGVQLPGPLAHPRDPTFRQYIVPLWLMWKSIPMEKATLFSVNTHSPVARHRNARFMTAVYKINPQYLLVTTANLSATSKESDVQVLDYKALGLKGAFDLYAMQGTDYWNFTVQKLSVPCKGEIKTGPVEPYGIRGYLLVQGSCPVYLKSYLETLARKEKAPPRDYLDFLKNQEEGNRVRHIPKGSKKLFLNFDVPNCIFGSVNNFFEIKIWNTEFAMTAKTAGYLCKDGIVQDKPTGVQCIKARPGEYSSGWMDFSDYLTPGNNVVTFTCYGEMTRGSGFVPIYYTGRIRLSDDRKNILGEYEFDNEIDKDSTSLSFSVDR